MRQEPNGKYRDDTVRQQRDSDQPPIRDSGVPDQQTARPRHGSLDVLRRKSQPFAIAAALLGAGWGGSEFMDAKADEEDVQEMREEQRQIKRDIRYLTRELGVEPRR